MIEKYDRDGTVLGSVNASSGFTSANGIALDADGNLYVSDVQQHKVERFDPTGAQTMTFGSAGTGPGQFQGGVGNGPTTIDSSGRVYVAYGGPNRGASPGVFVFDRDGHYLAGFGATAAGPDQITSPEGLVLDGAGNLYVSDAAGQNDRALTSWLLKFQLLDPLAP